MQASYDHEQLIDYIEGELPPEAMARVDAMLAADARLRRLIEAMKADRKALRAMPADEVPYPIVDDVLGGLERQMLLGDASDSADIDPIEAEAQRRRMRIGPRVLRVVSYTGIAAALLLAGGVVVVTLSSSDLVNEADPNRWDADGKTLAHADESASGGGGTRLGLDDLEQLDSVAKATGTAGDAAGAAVADAGRTFAKGGSKDADGTFRGKGAGKMASASRDAGANTEGQVQGQAMRVADAGFHDRDTVNAARSWGNRGQFALSLPEPDQTNLAIEVVSDDPALTTAGLNAWLGLNDAQLVEASTVLVGYDADRSAGGDGATERAKTRAASQAAATSVTGPATESGAIYCVVLDEEQVPELMAYMNNTRVGRQRAVLVEQQTPQRVALADVDAAVRSRSAEVARRQSPAPRPADTAVEEAVRGKMPGSVAKADAQQRADPVEGDLQRQVNSKVGAMAESASAAPAEDALHEAKQGKSQAVAQARQPSQAVLDDAQAAQAGVQADVTRDQTRGPGAGDVDSADPPAAQQELEPKREQLVDRALAQQPNATGPGDEPRTQPAAEQDADAVVADARVMDEVNSFNWGAVLGNQLPLDQNTPLVLAQRGRVVLPVVIREARGLDAASLLAPPADAEPANAADPAAPNAPAEVEAHHAQ